MQLQAYKYILGHDGFKDPHWIIDHHNLKSYPLQSEPHHIKKHYLLLPATNQLISFCPIQTRVNAIRCNSHL